MTWLTVEARRVALPGVSFWAVAYRRRLSPDEISLKIRQSNNRR
jgi:hypothetical protein